MLVVRRVQRPPGLRFLMIGDRIPDLTLPLVSPHPAVSSQNHSLRSLFTGRKSLVLTHPGAFTFLSSSRMLPEYMAALSALQTAGIQQVLALSVNDKFVQTAFAQRCALSIGQISDWRGELTHTLELGLPADLYFAYVARRAIFLVDESATVLGLRCEESVLYTRQTAPSSALAMVKACFGSPS